MGKKPDVMELIKQDDKIFELIYTKSSRIICSETKKMMTTWSYRERRWMELVLSVPCVGQLVINLAL